MRVQVSRAIQTFRVIAVRAIRVLVAILALVELPIVLLGQVELIIQQLIQ